MNPLRCLQMLALSSSILAVVIGFAQQPSLPPTASASAAARLQRLPLGLLTRISQVGPRFSSEDKQRVLYTGSLRPAKEVARPLTLSWQWPGLIRIDEIGAARRSVTFDGIKITSSGAMDSLAEGLLESLGFDVPENLLRLADRGCPVELVAVFAQIGDHPSQHYTGPWVDTFRVLIPFPDPGVNSEAKLFNFDAQTRLPASVVYRKTVGSKESVVQTAFRGWDTKKDPPTPAEIVRIEDGIEVFNFQVAQIASLPALPSTAFIN